MIIDLRSDTVTRPTLEMRRQMADAEVGDDVLGDDPTIIRLQEKFATLMGMEAACYVPSGTMANQASIRAHTEPGDEVIAHEGSHIIHYETGAPAALSGVMVRPLAGAGGLFDADQLDEAVRPYSAHFARSRLLIVENTHNRGGGTIWPLEQIKRVTARARVLGLKCHLDGARLWNACAATGVAPAEYARHFDTVASCFSKGLGAPAGSAVAGDKETIFRVHRFRKMFGGAMRQAGILAQACIYALDHHRERLVEDHANAKRLATGLSQIPGLRVDMPAVQTNMVFFDLDRSLAMNAAELCKKCEALGVKMLPGGPRRIRLVCHLDVTSPMIDRAVEQIAAALGAVAV
ncbi:MAG: GntG family PLP-dependent aldolase [Planctomycetota bacterium]